MRCRKGRQQQEGLAPSILHWRSPQARGWEGCSDTSELCPPSSLACWEDFSIEKVSYSVDQAAFQLVVNSWQSSRFRRSGVGSTSASQHAQCVALFFARIICSLSGVLGLSVAVIKTMTKSKL